MSYKVNEEGWQYQDRTDAEMAADISRDRNMLDFCAYNNNGYPFVTLAGIMNAGNKEGISVLECTVTETDTHFSALVKVGKKPDADGWQDTSYSSRQQLKTRDVYRNGNWVSEPDPYADTIAVNVAIKNAMKNLLYGSSAIEQMMAEFLEKNPEPPKPAPKPDKNGNGQPPPPKQEQKPKEEKPPKEEAKQEAEKKEDGESSPTPVELPKVKGADKESTDEWVAWKKGLADKPISDLKEACESVYDNSLAGVFESRELKAIDATKERYGYGSNDFTGADYVDLLDAMCLCLEGQGWMHRWIQNGGKLSDEDKNYADQKSGQ